MRSPDPLELMTAGMETALMLAEAQWVIALRLAGMAGFWPMGAGETSRMMTEKVQAGQDSAMAAMRAGMAGGSAGNVALAAIQPLRQRTKANAKRLTRALGGAK